MPEQRKGKTYYTNEEISGVLIRFYAVSADDHKEGGEHKFGIETVLPDIMREGVDWERCKEDEDYRTSFTSGSLMMHVDCMEKTIAMHPDCIEVTDFFGKTHDVSDLGIKTLIEPMIQEAAKAQYDKEKAKGIIPRNMSLKEWMDVVEASPETGIDLANWNPPKGKGH